MNKDKSQKEIEKDLEYLRIDIDNIKSILNSFECINSKNIKKYKFFKDELRKNLTIYAQLYKSIYKNDDSDNEISPLREYFNNLKSKENDNQDK